MKRMPILALCLALLAACTATTPPPPAEYLLQPSLPSGATTLSEDGYAIAIGRLDIPPYLDREGIVLETADRRLAVAQSHRWAEPLGYSLRRLLQLQIARDSGLAVAAHAGRGNGAALVVDVGIHEFHGTEAGLVTLAADWTLRRPRDNRIVGHHQLVREMRTDADGYDALVRTHLALAQALAAAIARSLDATDAAVRQP